MRSLIVFTVFVALCAGGIRAADIPAPVFQWIAARAQEDKLPDDRGTGPAAKLHGVIVMRKTEDLVEHPYLFFDGASHAETPDIPALNPARFSIEVWFRVQPGAISAQTPLLVKSAPAHREPWYQYGLFILDDPEHPQSLSAYVALNGRPEFVEARHVELYSGWNCAATTYDGRMFRLYMNGEERAARELGDGVVTPYSTPLLLGAYANLPKQPPHGFEGFIGAAAFWGEALPGAVVRARYGAEKTRYPETATSGDRDPSEYARKLNEALRQGRDSWGEDLIARGGATYDNIKEYLRPLFFSTGHSNETLGVHNLLFAEDGGAPPYVVPLADGSRIAANKYESADDVRILVGGSGEEPYGSVLERLEGPALGGGYYPIVCTGYTDAAGMRYAQECFAARIPGLNHLAAFLRITATATARGRASIRFVFGQPGATRARTAPRVDWVENVISHGVELEPGASASVYLLWSPQDPLPEAAAVGEDAHRQGRAACQQYWDALLGEGALFEAPEPLVMDVQRNHLIQNLMMRWRYSLGAVVYHDSYFQPESSDTASVMAMYGFTGVCRDSLGKLAGWSKGEQYYSNWERGEKLSHGAHYYFTTRDDAFLETHTPAYIEIIEELRQQLETDPYGLLRKQRHCGDIPEAGYCTFHLAVCWRGLRDMAEAWGLAGRTDLHARFRPVADRFRAALEEAVRQSSVTLPDDTLFVPSMLLDSKHGVFDPITETRMGSYWNLCMPYAFASGLWDPEGQDYRRILAFMHRHGAILLGLIRFNYYPVPIGSWRAKGLPGYYTTGYDNVYAPSYIRMLADLDEPDRLVLSFYGKLAHGQTRGTFVSGEGETLGTRPPEFYRSCYGTPCSANNSVFLLALRLMLLSESCSNETGLPKGLTIAPATPREWLASGKQIRAMHAPTLFGPVRFSIASALDQGEIRAEITPPDRETPQPFRLRLRTPGKRVMHTVTINGRPHAAFDPDTETIDLTGLTGSLMLGVRYE